MVHLPKAHPDSARASLDRLTSIAQAIPRRLRGKQLRIIPADGLLDGSFQLLRADRID